MKAVYNISYGVYVLAAKTDKLNACVINTLCQVTTSPNRVVVTVNKNNFTCKQIEKSKAFNVSILDEQTDFELIKHFGFSSGVEVNKFENFADYKLSENGLPYLTKNTNAYLSCKVIDQKDLGSHIMFFADVENDVVLSNSKPLTYAYYQSNIKPKSNTKKPCYVCSVCGYVYEGDEVPDDFICPLCKHDKSAFVKQGEEKEEPKEEKQKGESKMKTYVCPVCGYKVEAETKPDKCIICGAEMQEAE